MTDLNRRSNNEQLETLTSQVLYLGNEKKQLKVELKASTAKLANAVRVVNNRNIKQLM